MARRSKAYLEGMNRLSEDLAKSKTDQSSAVAKRELKESRNEVLENTEWLVSVPKELKNAGAEVKNAPTTNQERPRAWTIAYHPSDRKLVVVFRDNTWWEYRNVPVQIWEGLKSSGSTGKYLRTSGLDHWPDMGPANMDEFSSGSKERISQTAQIGSRLGTKLPVPDDFNIKNFTAKELFNEIL
jgi:hypothetical protein